MILIELILFLKKLLQSPHIDVSVTSTEFVNTRLTTWHVQPMKCHIIVRHFQCMREVYMYSVHFESALPCEHTEKIASLIRPKFLECGNLIFAENLGKNVDGENKIK